MDKKGEIRLGDEGYPELLRNIKGAPESLFYSGRPELLRTRCFAVVGTRKPTPYGRWAAHGIAASLAGAGITVVSGMAAGIDTCAHKGALEAGGNTIAVFGCGIDVCFPRSSAGLMNEIKEKGLAVSEYPGRYPASRYTFPRRNRIISGLSEGVIVIEAGLRSGSLITAGFAGEQGRSVYALPGNINSAMSIGTNKLLRDGAVPVAVMDDIISDLGIMSEKTVISREGLDKDENDVLDIIVGKSEMSLNELCGKLNFEPEKTMGIVTVLEMKGLVCTSLGKIFIAK